MSQLLGNKHTRVLRDMQAAWAGVVGWCCSGVMGADRCGEWCIVVLCGVMWFNVVVF